MTVREEWLKDGDCKVAHRVIVTWERHGSMWLKTWSPCTRCGATLARIPDRQEYDWWHARREDATHDRESTS